MISLDRAEPTVDKGLQLFNVAFYKFVFSLLQFSLTLSIQYFKSNFLPNMNQLIFFAYNLDIDMSFLNRFCKVHCVTCILCC